MGEVYQLMGKNESKPLPGDIEAEALLLGAILIDNEIYGSVASVVSADDFSEPLHARIFTAAAQRIEAGKAANPVLLKPEFDNDEAMRVLGGVKYLAQLSQTDAGILSAGEIARQIHEYAARRRLIEQFRSGADAAHNLETPLAEIISLADNQEIRSVGATFELLDLDDLENMPPPEWLVHEVIGKDSLSILYGEPGAGKSFVALDLGLRVARGMDWHGTTTKPTGVLYIAGEGARGIGKRVTGWRLSQKLCKSKVPFRLIPQAIDMLDPSSVYRLIRTIEDAKRRMNCEVGLIILDTVSRSIPGADENSQETMTAFVNACDMVKMRAGGALLGIHHTGKDRERGMRGSSVLLGAVDAAIRLEKDEESVTLKFEKQKDAEAAHPVYFELDRFDWNAGDEDNPAQKLSTLIPRKITKEPSENGISKQQIRQAFALIEAAWEKGKPLSHRPETRKDGRFAPLILKRKFGAEITTWQDMIAGWLEHENLTFETVSTATKMKGLKAQEWPVLRTEPYGT